jgi:mannose-6-phosphate isomerase-like protein (cupin superfamily)
MPFEIRSTIPGKTIGLRKALAQVPGPQGQRFAELFKHGTVSVEIYAPKQNDPQTPHARDEAYIVVSGGGEFVFGDLREKFGAGDFLFAPAGVSHRFEHFTDDLVVWVIFWGPEGGECS